MVRYLYLLFFLFISALFLVSCEKPSNDEIPSYVSIDSIYITTNLSVEGTASHKITDAWVYLGTKLIGAFEITGNGSTRIPILKEGKDTLWIYPGIKMNGMSGTRVDYPFYNIIKIPVTLERGVVKDLGTLRTTYVSSSDPSPKMKFVWFENFETGTLSLDSTVTSDIKLKKVTDPSLLFKYPTSPDTYEPNGVAGLIEITNDTSLFECVSQNVFDLPTTGKEIFLELNYRSNNSFTVGLLSYKTMVPAYIPVLTIHPSDSWNKIYVNLTTTVLYQGTSSYKIFFRAMKDKDVPQANIYLDNIKLMYKK